MTDYLPDCLCDTDEICRIHSATKRKQCFHLARKAMINGKVAKADYDAWRAKWANKASGWQKADKK